MNKQFLWVKFLFWFMAFVFSFSNSENSYASENYPSSERDHTNFRAFLKRTHRNERRGQKHRNTYIYVRPGALNPITQKQANGGHPFFTNSSDYQSVVNQLQVFNSDEKKGVRVFVCVGRYYLPRTNMGTFREQDIDKLTTLAGGAKTDLKNTFQNIAADYLQQLDAEYPNEKKIVLFGFEFVWSSQPIGPNGEDYPIQTDVVSIDYVAVDNSLKDADGNTWQFGGDSFNTYRPDQTAQLDQDLTQSWLQPRIAAILAASESYLNGGNGAGALGVNGAVVNYARSVSGQAIREALAKLTKTRQETRTVTAKLFLTDTKTTVAERAEVEKQIAARQSKDVIIWADFDADGNAKPQFFFGSNYGQLSAWNRAVKEVFGNTSYTTANINVFTALLDGLSWMVAQLRIPERFYNPESKDPTTGQPDYNATIADVYYYISKANPNSVFAQTMLVQIRGVDDAGRDKTFGPHRVELAFVCGFWNGLVDQVQGLPDLASWLIKMTTNEPGPDGKGTRDAFLTEWDKFKQDCQQNNTSYTYGGCVWDVLWSKIKAAHTDGNACMIAAQYGSDASNLLTFFMAFTKVSKVAKVSQLLEALDASTYIFRGAGYLLRYTLPNLTFAYRLGKATVYLVIKTAGEGATVTFQIMAAQGGRLLRTLDKGLDELLGTPDLAIIDQGDRLLYGLDAFPPGGQIEDILDNTGKKIQDTYGNYLAQVKDAAGNYKLAIVKVRGSTGSAVRSSADVTASLSNKLGRNSLQVLQSWASKNLNQLNYQSLTGQAAVEQLFKDLDDALTNQSVLNAIEDAQGRLSVICEGTNRNHMFAVHATVRGEFAITKFEPAYKPSANPNINAPLSRNGLVPDYAGTPYMYKTASGQDVIIRIKMAGKRKGTDGDFHLSNKEANTQFGTDFTGIDAPNGYVWHHMDDLVVDANGDVWCTMQLVDSDFHTGIQGMAHSGSVAQYKAYFQDNSLYKQ